MLETANDSRSRSSGRPAAAAMESAAIEKSSSVGPPTADSSSSRTSLRTPCRPYQDIQNRQASSARPLSGPSPNALSGELPWNPLQPSAERWYSGLPGM